MMEAKVFADRIALKISLSKIFGMTRKNPFYSEWKGLEEALEIMGVEYRYEFNDAYEITAVNVAGARTEVDAWKEAM